MSIASGIGRLDPHTALEWARAQGSDAGRLIASVISTIIEEDASRALDILLEVNDEIDVTSASMLFASRVAENPQDFPTLADRLADHDSNLASRTLSMLVSTWAYEDAESALAWMSANSRSVDSGLFSAVARGMARYDIESAKQSVFSVPTDARGVWINQVASILSDEDPVGAYNWVRQFERLSEYDNAAAIVAQRIAKTNSDLSVRLLNGMNEATRAQVAPIVAMGWAERNPRDAAVWAESLENGVAAGRTLDVVGRAWGSQDLEEAMQWGASIRGRDARDQFYAGALVSAALEGTGDTRMARVFSSDTSAIQAFRGAIEALRYHSFSDDWVANFLARNATPDLYRDLISQQ
jgi:hypothetical protein